MSRGAGTVAAAVATAIFALAPPASAATKKVDIERTKFDPAVITVGPGTTVEWTNKTGATHALRGDFTSTDIAPGQKFTRRFPRIGRFDYRDRDNPLLTGTVIVAVIYAGGRPRYPSLPPSSRIVTHRWRGTLTFDVREDWKYMDGKFLSFEGPCNAQVGNGSRTAGFRATYPDVRYTRLGTIEVLTGKSNRYGIQRYRELVDSKSSDPTGPQQVDCGDGSRDAPATIEQKCDNNFAGRRVRGELAWGRTSTRGRFFWEHDFTRPPTTPPARCGHSFLNAGSLAGLNPDQLPWDPGAGGSLWYDAGRTSPLSSAEVRALRNGRALTITREFEVHFTVDCCVEWREPGKSGTYVRVGAKHNARGKVTLRLTPR